FFQAEDGIRDRNVTGVQTCALPISSGMSSTVRAYHAIKAGEGDLFITGGMEHMTRGPMVLGKGSQPYSGTNEMHDSTFGWRFVNPKMHEEYGSEAMGQTAENIVAQVGVYRKDQDHFAAWSQQKAVRATENGRLAKEIFAVKMPQRKSDPITFDKDEFIRPDATVEVLRKLPTVFREGGTVTPGNASGINDGAA